MRPTSTSTRCRPRTARRSRPTISRTIGSSSRAVRSRCSGSTPASDEQLALHRRRARPHRPARDGGGSARRCWASTSAPRSGTRTATAWPRGVHRHRPVRAPGSDADRARALETLDGALDGELALDEQLASAHRAVPDRSVGAGRCRRPACSSTSKRRRSRPSSRCTRPTTSACSRASPRCSPTSTSTCRRRSCRRSGERVVDVFYLRDADGAEGRPAPMRSTGCTRAVLDRSRAADPITSPPWLKIPSRPSAARSPALGGDAVGDRPHRPRVHPEPLRDGSGSRRC